MKEENPIVRPCPWCGEVPEASQFTVPGDAKIRWQVAHVYCSVLGVYFDDSDSYIALEDWNNRPEAYQVTISGLRRKYGWAFDILKSLFPADSDRIIDDWSVREETYMVAVETWRNGKRYRNAVHLEKLVHVGGKWICSVHTDNGIEVGHWDGGEWEKKVTTQEEWIEAWESWKNSLPKEE